MLKEKNMDSQARVRLSYLFDEGTYTEINSYLKENDEYASVITAYGYVNGNEVYAFSQDKTVMNGAVGKAHAKKIEKLYSLAAKTGTPVVGIHDSNGAFVDGTASSISAYGKMISASTLVSGVVPQISVIAGTCAGSAAMFACTSDFVLMTKDSEFFMLANAKDTSSEVAAKNGVVSIICDDDKIAMDKVRSLVNLMPVNNLAPTPMFEAEMPTVAVTSDVNGLVNGVADAESVVEIYSEYGTASYTALSTINGTTAGIIATNKTSDKLNSDDCSKISRFVRLCDAFSIPVVTFVDTDGFDVDSTVTGIKAMTQVVGCYAEATTVKISVVTGKAIGPSFVALAGKDVNTDFTFAWENACIASMAPTTAVEFLWHDKLKGAENLEVKRNELVAEYKSTLASAETAANMGYIDDVITPETTRTTIISALEVLSGKRVTKLPKKHNNIPF